MNMLLGSLQSLFASVGPFFILLGILIFVHELGHFSVAKYFGIRVEVFSMGFGKALFSFKRGDTLYAIRMIPLGGYVKMYGDDPNAEIPADQKQFAFLHKPVYQRFAVVLAGPLMNLFFAFFVFSLIVGVGEDVASPTVGDVTQETAAYQDGFRSGDKILQIGEEKIATWNEVQKAVEAAGGKTVEFTIEHNGETQPQKLTVTVPFGENENVFSVDRQVGRIEGFTQESRSTLVGVKSPQSPAGLAGVKTMDLITTINGKKISYWRELEPMLQAAAAGDAKTLRVQVRDIEKSEKAEADRMVEIALPPHAAANTTLTESLGLEPAELYIYQISKNSPAARAGIQAKDKIVRIGKDSIAAWNGVLQRVKGYKEGSGPLDFVVMREGQEKSFSITPEMTAIMSQTKGKEEHRFTIGIVSGFFPMGPEPVLYRLTNPVQIVQHGLKETWYWTEFVVMSTVRLFQGEVSAKNLGGVITIGRVASHSFAAGFSTFMRMMGLISINLFLLNLMPVPVLDGGHLVFYTIEALKGTPLSLKKMEIAQKVGLMLLMFLMAFAFFNDISNLISTRM